jgi:hypothetical protein
VDLRALRRALVEAGVPDGVYEIAGVHEPVPPSPDFVFLRRGRGRRRSKGWESGVYERGVHQVGRRFDTEDEACRYVFRLLTGDPPPADDR